MSATKEFIDEMNSKEWGPLVAKNVAKLRLVDGTPGYVLNFTTCDQLISTELIDHPVGSVTELIEFGMTAIRMGHEILGLAKNDKTLTPKDGGKYSVSELLGLVVKSRLGNNTDGNVQKLLNSTHGLWLVAVRFDGTTYYGATRNPALIDLAFTGPRLLRQVSAKVKEAVTAMTVAHRVPEAAAQFIASADVQAESLALARRRTYAQITDGMDAAEIRELDAAIGAHTEQYRTATGEKFDQISKAEPSVPKSKDQDGNAAA